MNSTNKNYIDKKLNFVSLNQNKNIALVIRINIYIMQINYQLQFAIFNIGIIILKNSSDQSLILFV